MERIKAFVKKRALNVRSTPRKLLEEQIDVIAVSEVISIFEMIENGEIEHFLQHVSDISSETDQ